MSACGGGSYDGDNSAPNNTQATAPSGGPNASSVRGRSVYIAQCMGCHDHDGRSVDINASLVNCNSCGSVQSLSSRITSTMPLSTPSDCEGNCAVDVANYILYAFNNVDVGSTAPPSNVNAAGHSNYSNQCLGCHGSDGNGTRQGPALVACASCENLETLSNRIGATMPIADPSQCTAECAQDTAEYILQAFNGQAVVGDTSLLDDLIPIDLKTTYRKASLNLAGRLPTDAELNEILTDGDAGFDRIFDDLLEEPAFYARMVEIWNDFLLQNKYLGGENAIGLLRDSDFPMRRWYNTLGLDTSQNGPERDLYFYLRGHANNAMAQESLQLITHLLKNNRPITEMLTADYIVGNYFSARSYGVENQHAWNTLDDPPHPSFPQDPSDFRPIRLSDPVYGPYPHSGLLTSIMFTNRFPSSNTNRNRHRSRSVYKLFLDTDVLELAGERPVDAEDINSPVPTLDNPDCSICHNVVDPVASIYQNWNNIGQYRPTRLVGSWHTDMQDRGFNGVIMPRTSDNLDRSVQWLAGRVVDDPRFTRSIVKSLFAGLTGQTPLPIPEAGVPENSPERRAYLTQDAYFRQLANELENANFDIHLTIKSLVKGPYFRADRLGGGDTAAHVASGSDRLLTPEMLNRKILATTGTQWLRSGRDRLLDQGGTGLNILYGGMDSDSITKRITEPNGLIAATQRRMASQLACRAIALDFFRDAGDRALFPFVETDDRLIDDQDAIDPMVEAEVIRNLRHLHWALLGRDVSETDPEILTLRDLMVSVQRKGIELREEGGHFLRNRLHFDCDLTQHPETGENLDDEDRILFDDNYVLRTWQAVLVYYLNDYRFVYE